MKQLTPDEIIHRGIYIQCFYGYGLLPMLYLLNEYEEQENYNECFFLKAAIDEINRQYERDFPTRYCKTAELISMQTVQKQGLDFSEFLKRLPTISFECMNYANSLKEHYLNKNKDIIADFRNAVKNIINH